MKDKELTDNVVVMAQQYALDKCQTNMGSLTKVKLAVEYGYNKAMEIYFSEEDMIDFADFCHSNNWEKYDTGTFSTKELLQLWKEQQIKK